MINIESQKTKYGIDFTKGFKKQFKKIIKQGKDIKKFSNVVEKLANKETLEPKFKNHTLVNCKEYFECGECHIEPCKCQHQNLKKCQSKNLIKLMYLRL